MTGPFAADGDATPLTPEERNGLIPTHVTLSRELDELEQQNIWRKSPRVQKNRSVTRMMSPGSTGVRSSAGTSCSGRPPRRM
jgi:hypothetical protein